MADQVFPYGDIADLHAKFASKDPFFKSMPLREFSQTMNEFTGSHAFDQGVNDSFIKQASHALDRFLRPVSDVTGTLGEKATQAVGLSKFAPLGRELGASIPRSVAELGAVTAGLAAGGLPGAALLGLGATSAGSKAYTETGSPAVGALTGGLTALIPYSAKLGEAAVRPTLTSLFYKEGVPIAGRSTVAKFVEPTAEALGRNVGMAINQEATIQGTGMLTGQGLQNPFTPEGMFQRVGGQVPFLMLDAIKIARGPGPTEAIAGRNEWRSNTEYLNAKALADAETAGRDFQAQQIATEAKRVESEVRTATKPTVPGVPDVPQPQSIQPTSFSVGEEKKTAWLNKQNATFKAFKAVERTGTFDAQTVPLEFRDGVVRSLQEAGVIDDKGQVIAKPQGEDALIEQARASSGTLKAQYAPEGPIQEVMDLGPTSYKQAPEKPVVAPETTEPGFSGQQVFEFAKIKPSPKQGIETPERTAKSEKGKTQFTLPDTVEELRALKEAQWELANTGKVPFDLFEAAKTKLEALESGMGLGRDVVSLSPLEQLRAQIIDKYGVKAGAKLDVEAPLEVRLAQVNDLIEEMTGVVKAAGEMHRWNSLLSEGAELKKYLSGLIDLGMPPEEVAVRAYEMQMKRLEGIVRAVDDAKAKLDAELLNDPVHVSKRKQDLSLIEQRVARLNELPEDKLRILARVTSSGLFYREGRNVHISAVEHDITSEVYAAAIRYQEKADIRAKARTLLEKDANELQAFEAYLRTAAKMALTRKQVREGFETASQKGEAEGLNLERMFEMATKEIPTPEELAMRDAMYRSVSELGPTDNAGWSQGGNKPFSRKVEEQVARMNKLLEFVKQATFGLAQRKNRPGEVGLTSVIPLKDVIAAVEPGMNQKAMQNFLRDEFFPRFKARWTSLGEVQEQRAGRSGVQKDPNLPKKLFSQAKSPYTSMVGAEAFFRTWLTNRGFQREQVELFTDAAMRIAAAFHDVGYTRIAELVSNTEAGLSWINRYDARRAFVAIRGYNTSDANVNVFATMATLGHELWHNLVGLRLQNRLPDWQQDHIDNAMKWMLELTPSERMDLTTRYHRMLIPEAFRQAAGYDAIEGYARYRAMDASEALADFAGLAVIGHIRPDRLTRVRELNGELLMEGPHVQQFAKGMYLSLFDLTTMLKDYFNTALPKGDVGTVFAEISQSVKASLKTLEYVDQAVNELNAVRSMDLHGLYARIAEDAQIGPISSTKLEAHMQAGLPVMSMKYSDVVDIAKDFLGVGATAREWEKRNGVQPGFFARYFAPSAQLSQLYPQLQPVFDLVRGYRSLANLAAVTIAKPFMGTVSKFGKYHVDMEQTGLKTLFRSERASRVATLIALDKQIEERVFTDAEMAEYTQGLSKSEALAVLNFHRKVEQSMPIAADYIVKMDTDEVAHVGAFMLQSKGDRSTPMKWNAHLGNAKAILAALIDSSSPDKVKSEQGLIQLEQLQQTTPGFVSAVNVMRPMLAKVLEKAALLKDRAWYMPEMRLGRYHVVWKETGKRPGRAAYATKAEAMAKERELLASKPTLRVKIRDQYDENTHGMDPTLLARIQEIETAKFNAAAAELGDSAEFQEFKARFRELYTPMEATITQVKGKGVERFSMQRSLAQGRESIDSVKNVIEYFSRLSSGLAKRYTSSQVGLALNDPDLKANPKLRSLAEQHFNHVLNPSGREWSLFKQMNFGYFMAFNPASMLMESAQSVLTLIPQFTRDTGSLAKSYQIWGDGVKTAVKSLIKGGKIDDPDLAAAVKKAQDELRLDFGTMQEFYIGEENALPNLANVLKGAESTLTASDIVKKPLYWYLNSSRWLYSQATRANSYTAFIAAYQHARKSMSFDEAYQYAVKTVDATMFGGGAAARPVGMFDVLYGSKSYGAMGMLYSLGTYTFSTIAMMARLGKEAITKGLPKEQQAAAQKAFGQMLLTQTALGGALSLPFAGASLAVIEQMFPQVQAKQGLKDMIAGLFADDQELGGFVSDIALKGAPSRYLNADLSSRMSLSQLMGVSPYDGFSLANLLGPTGAVLRNLATGANQLAQGDVAQGVKSLLPVPYKNVLELYNSQGAVRDKGGNLIYEPTKGEQALFVLGLRPKKLTDFREAQRNIERSENVKRMEESKFYQELAQKMIEGDTTSVRQALVQRQQNDPMFSAVAGGRRVVEEVEKRITPIDLARTGSKAGAAERQRMQASLADRGLPTEIQRLQMRETLSRQLGLQPVRNRMALTLAQMVDRMMELNPMLSRQEATVTVERMLGRGMRSSFMQ